MKKNSFLVILMKIFSNLYYVLNILNNKFKKLVEIELSHRYYESYYVDNNGHLRILEDQFL